MTNEINIQDAESLNTTTEIITAINEISGDTRDAMQIWDDPTDMEFRSVIVRRHGLSHHECNALSWGCSTISVDPDADTTDFSARYSF